MDFDLTFKDWQEKIKSTLGKTEWITVLSRSELHHDVSRGGFYSALVSNDIVDKSLENYSWDLLIGHGMPGFVTYSKGGESITEYHRFSDDGIEPIVYWRDFHGVRENYYEISEEFRLYFNLFEDKKSLHDCVLIHIDDNGDDIEVVKISKNEVKIKLKYIKEFLAAKKMRLAIFFDFMRFSGKSLEELKLEEMNDVVKSDDYIYSVCVRDIVIDTDKSQGWLLGKKLISGLKDFNPDIFGRNEKRKYEDFIIGIDEDGNSILHTCDENKLANYFGKNPDAPHYLTPVYFTRDVLKKYYDNPDKFSVDDGNISCRGLWSLRIDNNHPKYVIAYLGDLGHLHHKEQLYWRSYNISSQEGISRVAWKRGFMAEFTDPERPDLYFKYKFEIFQKAWFDTYGWYLFKPLSKGDSHHLDALHVPTTNDQKEFDEQVLSLTKILIDSLNEKKLVNGIGLTKENPKGIDKFELFLESKKIRLPGMLEFIRNLQFLRSTSVAHRKSDKNRDYAKARKYFKLEEKSHQEVFEDILIKSIWILNSLENQLLKEK